jgi:hypothetical protein
MFTIYGGKTEFHQWDLNQRVVEPRLCAGDKVIFLNSSGMTFPMVAYSYRGEVVVDVPNKILTMAMPIVMYINGYYETRTSFNVVAKEKPENYVFVDNDDWPSVSLEDAMPKMLDLKDYGIDYASLLLAGGGAAVYEDVGSFWEDVNAVKPGQSLLLTSDFMEVTIVPPPSTLYFTAAGTEVGNILTTMTFLFSNKFLTATSYLTPHGTSGAALSVAVTGTVDAPQPK